MPKAQPYQLLKAQGAAVLESDADCGGLAAAKDRQLIDTKSAGIGHHDVRQFGLD